ncbi:hypothetical protein C6A85_56810, partial [Mycobacterium sp. ITM-2017-0098]
RHGGADRRHADHAAAVALTLMPPERTRIADAGLVALAAMRIGIGALAWTRPDVAAKMFGFSGTDGQSRYLWRLFGVRDVLVGLGT